MTSTPPPAHHSPAPESSTIIKFGDGLCFQLTPSTPPRCNDADEQKGASEMYALQMKNAQRVCEAAERDGRLLHVVEITRTDRDGNFYQQWYRETPAQAVHRCVQEQLDGDEDAR